MLPAWAIPLLACIANFVIGVLVYRRARHNSVSRLFTVTTATIVSWNLNLFALYYFDTADKALFWSTLFRTGTLLMPPTIVHLFLVFGGRRSRATEIYICVAYSVAAALVVANMLGLLVSDVRPHEWGFYPVARPLYGVHVGSVCVNLGIAAYLLITNVTGAKSPQKKLQAKFWLLGAGIGILGGITNLLPIYEVGIYPIGNLANVAYTAIVSYAIIRHRLVDFDTVLARAISYSLVGLLLVAPAFAVVLYLEKRVFGFVDPGFSLATLGLFVFIGTSVPAFRLWAEKRVARSLFRQKEEYREALREFTRKVVRILDRGTLIRTLGQVLGETLRLDNMALYLKADGWFVREFGGDRVSAAMNLSENDRFVTWLGERSGAVVRDETASEADSSKRPLLESAFSDNGWEVCVPIFLSGKLSGFIGLGTKRGMEAYASTDLDLLDALAAEVAIALENARLYEQLRSSQEVIRRAGKLSALGTLAAGIAHEIRNPLVAIQTFFQLAPQRLGDEEFITEFLSITESEVKRICDLISDLLGFAKSPERVVAEVRLLEVVASVVRLLIPQARKRGVRLELGAASQVAVVRLDEDQIKQVLVNLVLNAIEATESGGSVLVSIRPVAKGGAQYWLVEVVDTGCGIAADLRDEVFNPFFTTKARGTGLGLAVSNQIVVEHGGFMELESRVGEGTKINVYLPADSFDGEIVLGNEGKDQLEVGGAGS